MREVRVLFGLSIAAWGLIAGAVYFVRWLTGP